VGSQAWPKSWRLLGKKTVDRKGNIPEFKIFGSDVIEMRGIFLLDLIFEDADIVGRRNLDSKHLTFRITDNEAVD
jgi:hypothetical protein